MQATRMLITKGYYYSPGFFMRYWLNAIEKQFSMEQIQSHPNFKPHRELWIGAIIAASQTKINGMPYFVGLPPDEPPDAEVVRFTPIVTAKGNEGFNLDRIGVEIVRCNMDEGENIFSQILLKNKPAYSGMSVAVYAYGGKKATNLNSVQAAINALDKIYPHEIMLVAPVRSSTSIVFEPGTHAITQFYPKMGQDLVNVLDTKAFFLEHNIRTVTQRGVGRESKNLGFIELMPPTIHSKRVR
jgi:hypothetical protein